VIGIYGPARPRRLALLPARSGLILGPPATPPFEVHAATPGDALNAYCEHFGATVKPYDGSDPRIPFVPGEEPKFFIHVDGEHGEDVVDIHLTRGGASICCKQRLAFILEDGDEIELGVRAC